MHHFGDGSNFLTISGQEYVDIFPVWDWQKIPGTTLIQNPEFPHWRDLAKKGLNDFTGGVTDGLYGAAAMDFKCPHEPVRARKAWFYFDREYVCLGAGINAEGSHAVVTTVDQKLLNKDVTVMSGNKRSSVEKGKRPIESLSWVHHDGVGYLFPGTQTVQVSNQQATGASRCGK